ncbi:hypothetical protein PNOK_0378000 [Pyrrhoderma noxium]|uniref:Uncharacterized protein n=1 Tax=Pyrrhoderma noxium TaxID=2282107 RepID=A0A286UNH9_9AGAM|nr:hypothetical protein PNOK_0378000 [Pyrrhoderma noxium]
MVVMLLAFLLAVLSIPCILMPDQVWKAFNVGDDTNEYGLNDINLVALRNPVRESGPPVCMAKLIMLRHKIHQASQKRRSRTPSIRHSRSFSRSSSRSNANIFLPQRPRSFSWMKFGKQMH